MEFDSNAHSVFLLNYNLILVAKYRRKVFDDRISERAKEIFSRIAPKLQYHSAGMGPRPRSCSYIVPSTSKERN